MYPDMLFVFANLREINRKEKDPLKPRHPISAFFAFSQSRRPALLEEKIPVTEVLCSSQLVISPSGQQLLILRKDLVFVTLLNIVPPIFP